MRGALRHHQSTSAAFRINPMTPQPHWRAALSSYLTGATARPWPHRDAGTFGTVDPGAAAEGTASHSPAKGPRPDESRGSGKDMRCWCVTLVVNTDPRDC